MRLRHLERVTSLTHGFVGGDEHRKAVLAHQGTYLRKLINRGDGLLGIKQIVLVQRRKGFESFGYAPPRISVHLQPCIREGTPRRRNAGNIIVESLPLLGNLDFKLVDGSTIVVQHFGNLLGAHRGKGRVHRNSGSSNGRRPQPGGL